MRVWVISDLHLTDGYAEEFTGDEKLTAILSSLPDRSVVLAGDVFDLLRAPLDAILKAHGPLLDLLFQKALFYVTGNHDRAMLNSSFSPPQFMGVPIGHELILGDTLFTHGDLFDPFNSDPSHIVGDSVVKLVDWLADNVSPGVNDAARELEKWWRSIGRNGDPAYYRDKALSYIEHMVVNWKRLSKVVLGHTHQVDYGNWNDRFEYFNSGCWIGGKTDVTEVEVTEAL